MPDFAEGSPTMATKSEAYKPSSQKLEDLGCDPMDIINCNGQWASTTWALFVENQLMLLKALLLCPTVEDWPNLWCSSLVPPGTVIRLTGHEVPYLVYHGSKFLLRCVNLKPRGPDEDYWLSTTSLSDQVLTTLSDRVMCAKIYDIVLDTEQPNLPYIIVAEWERVGLHIGRASLHTLSKDQMADFSEMLGGPRSRIDPAKKKALEMVHDCLMLLRADAALYESCMAKATARLARYSRKTGEDKDDADPPEDCPGPEDLDEEIREIVKGDVEHVRGVREAVKIARPIEEDSNQSDEDSKDAWSEASCFRDIAPSPPPSPVATPSYDHDDVSPAPSAHGDNLDDDLCLPSPVGSPSKIHFPTVHRAPRDEECDEEFYQPESPKDESLLRFHAALILNNNNRSIPLACPQSNVF